MFFGFPSTLSLRRATALKRICVRYLKFLSTLSLRRATPKWFRARRCPANFYPRSPCGERLEREGLDTTTERISIHALLAESDSTQTVTTSGFSLFLSTLSLRRATPKSRISISVMTTFLSTLSLRRATHFLICQVSEPSISIHALLAESDANLLAGSCVCLGISIHALLAESDYFASLAQSSRLRIFLSTLSLRRATTRIDQQVLNFGISIHALLAESDQLLVPLFRDVSHFYPRSPCGERRRYRRTS